MSGREDFEERREARIDRLNNAACKASEEANTQFKRSHDLVSNIPLGQPNIIGRSALPKLREKSRNALCKSVELDDKANYYSDKAEAAESNRSIFSDDPAAIDKLKIKLFALETERDQIKESNKAARKNGTAPAAWYELPYLSKNIKTVKERIAKLERVDQMPAEIIVFDGGEIDSNAVTNRIIIRFDERCGDEMCETLKHNGFKWAPSEKGWQRLRNPNALYYAKKICGVK